MKFKANELENLPSIMEIQHTNRFLVDKNLTVFDLYELK